MSVWYTPKNAMSKFQAIEAGLDQLARLPGVDASMLVSAEGLILAAAQDRTVAGVGGRVTELVAVVGQILNDDVHHVVANAGTKTLVVVAAQKKTRVVVVASAGAPELLEAARKVAASLAL